jgi:hypothetical protein
MRFFSFYLVHQDSRCFIISPRQNVKIRVVNTKDEDCEWNNSELHFTASRPYTHLVFETVNWGDTTLEQIVEGLRWYSRQQHTPDIKFFVA